jgi:hypothetical protein
VLPYSPYSDTGNIFDAAKLLRDYLDLYGTYFLAFKRYKGYSKKGEIQAHQVMVKYHSI